MALCPVPLCLLAFCPWHFVRVAFCPWYFVRGILSAWHFVRDSRKDGVALEQFWSRWRKEYLFNLSERQKWNTQRRNVVVGDIVMLTDVEVSRMEWPLAIVIEAHKYTVMVW